MKGTIFSRTEQVLLTVNNFTSAEGKLLRNKVLEASEKMDSELLSALISDDVTKKAYFTDVDGILVFDKQKFSWIVQNKSFLPDSYTRYKNKIGLMNSKGGFIAHSHDVELVFPHKECILEGGQTKEDQKKDEIFYNELLSPDEITTLMAPKAFCNAKKYDKSGCHEVTEITDEDNLIIKGNNLLALSSLLERYRGQVKCIYIDPPYNTGNDSFKYNDSFNHSAWLTFMKNRLEIARKLLTKDGLFFISLDDKENHYCKILMDELFGRENFIADICHKSRGSISNDKIISPNHNHILLYAMNERVVYENREKYGIEKDLSTFTEKDNNGYYKLVPVDGPGGDKKGNPHYTFLGITHYWRFSEERMKSMYEKGLIIKKGNSLLQKYYKSKAIESRQTITTWWDEGYLTSSATSELKKLELEESFDNPKNESLLELIIEFATQKNDIVLDFNLGSGTTAAVALKMNRRYIGVEQMDYIESITVKRLQKVIDGEQSGISKSAHWQGGGSFVYCELAKLNQSYVDRIQSCKTDNEITTLTDEILKSDFVSSKVKPSDINTSATDYNELTFSEKQKFAMELLDKNQLYVNYSERHDPDMKLSESDIAFSESFYGDKA
ncbi:MAG: site-specific DNA-methyltransferase [Treponema sp.]|nr:site-specific DNA-methyltransferase [Candidatus Treponema caballi]